MSTTWLDFLGPVSIYLDGEWQNGILREILKDEVVYSLSDDAGEYIMTKDDARSMIRDRKVVSSAGKGQKYTGSNPLVFGPAGASIYGKKITTRKDRPNMYRVEIKYKPLKYGKVSTHKIGLGKHVGSLLFLCVVCFLFIYLFVFLCFNLSECVCVEVDIHSAEQVCDKKNC